MNNTENPARTCAWCKENLSTARQPTGLGAEVDRDQLTIDENEYMIGIEFPERDRTVYALVPPPESPAGKSGHDLWFTLCSEECGKTLEKELRKGLDMVQDLDIQNLS